MAVAPVEFSAVSYQLLEALEVLDRSHFSHESGGVKRGNSLGAAAVNSVRFRTNFSASYESIV